MSCIQVKKVVAVLFLESAKLTLDHIAAHRLELSNSGVAGAADVPRFYGDVRRLRDYLQRCLTGHQESVTLEISAADCGLLVACCRRMYEALDQRIVAEQIMTADEKALIQRKRQVLGDWAVEMAEKPVVELPIPTIGKVHSEAVRALRTRINNKLFKQRVIHGVGQQQTRTSHMSAGVSILGQADTPQEQLGALPSVQPDEVGEEGGHAPASAPPKAKPEPVVASLIDSARLSDPRLRSLVGVDLRSFERAVAARDFRIATVLLGCVLESVVLDHCIQNRANLSLSGGPETWNLSELLTKCMGAEFSPQDRSSLFHLFAARNLLRPALQITTPTVVTGATLKKLQGFVERSFRSLGFTSTEATADEASAGETPETPSNMHYGLDFGPDESD